MHGITPPPFEIPPERLPQPKKQKSGRPRLLSFFAIMNLIQGVVFLLLAMVPWTDPDSSIAAVLIAHHQLVFGLFPRFIQPAMGMDGVSVTNVLPGLAVIFLILAVYYILAAWKLWDMDPYWYFIIRWSLMCSAGYTVAKFFVAILADYTVAAGPRLISDGTIALMAPVIAWNLVVLGYFALSPEVIKAYDS